MPKYNRCLTKVDVILFKRSFELIISYVYSYVFRGFHGVSLYLKNYHTLLFYMTGLQPKKSNFGWFEIHYKTYVYAYIPRVLILDFTHSKSGWLIFE